MHKIVKTILLIFIAVSVTGCALSRNHHVIPVEQKAIWSDDSCGYWSNRLKFGKENKAIVSGDSYKIEFCSIDFYSKTIAGGLIIPLFPIFNGSEYKEDKRWVRVKNLNEQNDVVIDNNFTENSNYKNSVKFSLQKTPGNDQKTINDYPNSKIELKPNDIVWVALPNENSFELNLKIKEQQKTIKFEVATSYGWYMLTN